MLLSEFYVRLSMLHQGRYATDGDDTKDTLKKAIAQKVREKLEQKSDTLAKTSPKMFALGGSRSDIQPSNLPKDFDLDSIDLNEVITDDNVDEVTAVIQRVADKIVNEIDSGSEDSKQSEKSIDKKMLDALEKSNVFLRQQNGYLKKVVDLLLKLTNVPSISAKNKREAIDKLADRYILVARLLTAQETPKGKWLPVKSPGAESKWKYVVNGQPVSYSKKSEKPGKVPEIQEEADSPEKPDEKTPKGEHKTPEEESQKKPSSDDEMKKKVLQRKDYKQFNNANDRKKFLDRLLSASPIGGGKGSLKFDSEADAGLLEELRTDIKKNPAYSGWKETTSKSGKTVTVTPPLSVYAKIGKLDYGKILQQGAVELQKKDDVEEKKRVEQPLGSPARNRPKESITKTDRPSGESTLQKPQKETISGPGPTQEKQPGKKPQESLFDFSKPSHPEEPTELLLEDDKKPVPAEKPGESDDLWDEADFQLEGEPDKREPTLEEVLQNPSKMELAPPTPLKPSWKPREKEEGVTADWYDPKDLIDPRTSEGKKKMADKGFETGSLSDSDGKAYDEIPSSTVVFNVYDGKTYTFDELPKELQDEMNKLQKEGKVNLAPDMKPEEVPEEILEKMKAALNRADKRSKSVVKKAKNLTGLVDRVSKLFKDTGVDAKHFYNFATSQLSKPKMIGRRVRDVAGSMFSKYFQSREKSLRSGKQSQTASAESRVMYVDLARRVAVAELMRLSIKDKDLMSDTGGVTKSRQREPKIKPPRYDLKVLFRKRRLKPSEMDPDTQRDPDIDDDPDIKS